MAFDIESLLGLPTSGSQIQPPSQLQMPASPENAFQLNSAAGGAFAGMQEQNLQDTMQRNFAAQDTQQQAAQLQLEQMQKQQPLLDQARALSSSQLGAQQTVFDSGLGAQAAQAAVKEQIAKSMEGKSTSELATNLVHAGVANQIYSMMSKPDFDWSDSHKHLVSEMGKAAGMSEFDLEHMTPDKLPQLKAYADTFAQNQQTMASLALGQASYGHQVGDENVAKGKGTLQVQGEYGIAQAYASGWAATQRAVLMQPDAARLATEIRMKAQAGPLDVSDVQNYAATVLASLKSGEGATRAQAVQNQALTQYNGNMKAEQDAVTQRGFTDKDGNPLKVTQDNRAGIARVLAQKEAEEFLNNEVMTSVKGLLSGATVKVPDGKGGISTKPANQLSPQDLGMDGMNGAHNALTSGVQPQSQPTPAPGATTTPPFKTISNPSDPAVQQFLAKNKGKTLGGVAIVDLGSAIQYLTKAGLMAPNNAGGTIKQ